jgi:hypothetical protein
MPGPQIEQYGDLKVGRRPIDAPLANPAMASPDAFGAPIADGARRAVIGIAQANQLRQEEERKRDEVESLDAFNQFVDQENDRRADYLTRTGSKALDLPKVAREDHDKSRDELEAKLTRPGSKERFRQLTDRRWLQTDAQIQGHTREQAKKYTADTFNGSIERLGLDALEDGSPAALEYAERMRRVERQRLGQHLGMDGQTLEVEHRKDAAGLYGAAISNAIEGSNWKTAEDYLARYGDRLDKSTRVQMEGKIRAGSLNQKAQEYTDVIFKSGYAENPADADRMIKTIDDADLRDRVQVKVSQEFARRKVALAEARGAAFESIAKEVDAGADVEDLIAKHRDAAALEQADKDQLRATAARAAARKAVPAGSDSYYALRNAAAVTPDAFMREDLKLYRGRISEPERQAMIELQADMNARRIGSATKDSKPARGLLSSEDVANGILRSIDINPNLADGKLDPRAVAFKTQLDKAILAEGGLDKLDNDRIRTIGMRLILEENRKAAASTAGKVTNFLTVGLAGMAGVGVDGETKVRAFEDAGADRRAFSVAQVPAESMPLAVEALRESGIENPTEDQILSTYNATVSKAP